MALSSGDLKIYGSANMPESGNALAGGAIDTTVRVVFDDATLANTLNDKIAIRSSMTADTGQVIITGRDSVGAVITEAKNLVGTGFVVGTSDFERILKVTFATHQGTISGLRAGGPTGIFAVESGVLTLRRPFYNVSADPTGGATRNYYEKVFVKNTSTTNALNDAVIIESADPSAKVTFALESGKGGTTIVLTRETSPHSGTAFDSATKAIPANVLSTGDNIGVWLNLTLSAGDAPAKTTYTLQASGTTT